MSVADADRLAEIEDALRIALSWVPDKHAAPPTEALDRLLALVRCSREREAMLADALAPFATGAEAFDGADQTYGDGAVFARIAVGANWQFTIANVRAARAALSVVADQPPAPVPAAKETQEPERCPSCGDVGWPSTVPCTRCQEEASRG